MNLLSVNVCLPKEIAYRGKTVTTGIFKEPVNARLRVGALGLDGDGQADRKVHGGADMAVYAYPYQHYGFWEAELGRRDLTFGSFGENLTITGISEDSTRVRDLFRIGKVLFQVTPPRIPCYKLAIRMAEEFDFPARFQASGRLGFYFRVREQGDVGAGDTVELIDRDENSVTIVCSRWPDGSVGSVSREPSRPRRAPRAATGLQLPLGYLPYLHVETHRG
jgi:MOSC domain-containing protein YiiM